MSAALTYLTQGRVVWLATILETWGSSPRPVGALLAVDERGQWAGSLSGGCLEADLIQKLLTHRADATTQTAATETADSETAWPHLLEYGISDSDQAAYQLPCGGRIRLLLEKLQGAEAMAHLSALVEGLRQGQRVTRRVDFSTGRFSLHPTDQPPGLTWQENILQHTLGAAERMLLIGAGEVARYVARIALTVDFAVTLCEPRAAFLQNGPGQIPWHEPGVTLVEALPDDLIKSHFNDRFCAILALAHDPRVDDMALLQALPGPAFYVGAMGSQRTSANRRQRLHELGLSASAIGRLHAPIGFYIGSKTPPEIALSIMAQVLAERHRLLRRLGDQLKHARR